MLILKDLGVNITMDGGYDFRFKHRVGYMVFWLQTKKRQDGRHFPKFFLDKIVVPKKGSVKKKMGA